MSDVGRVVTMQSSPEEKIRLFRAMFCGREGVFAERWESKAGKTGYQPTCANQWIRGVCPKCAAFLAEDVLSDLGAVIDRIVRHLPKKMVQEEKGRSNGDQCL